MCSIAGLLDKSGKNITTGLLQMLQQTSHRGPDGCGIYISGIIKKASDPEHLDTDDVHGTSGLGHSRLQITGSVGIQPLEDCEKRFILGFNGEIWNYRELRAELALGGHVFETDSDGEVIVHLVEEHFKNTTSLSESVLHAHKKLDGEYAFAIFDTSTKKVALTRDSVGIKQLYYGQNEKYFAFCSEKKPLWDIGIEPRRVLPGEIVETNFDANSKPFFVNSKSDALQRPFVKLYDEKMALARYKEVLFDSVRKRIDGRDKVGVIFSGGVDSVLIARIVQMLSCDVTCYATGFKGSPDVIAAIQSAKELGLKLNVHYLDEEEIRSELENIIFSIESTNHLQVDVAIPIFFAVKEAKKDMVKVILTGQGADEIFAGYPWYPEILKREGSKALNQSLWNDIENLYKDTLEREDKISMYHSIELRVPYLDPKVIDVAMSISDDLKIKGSNVKYLHRMLAQDVGVPLSIAWREKEAAQHGSHVHNNLLKIIEKMNDTACNTISLENTENLGSAYRYNHDVYKENKSTQNTLNHLGKKIGLYPREM
ncbi:MAG: asparagine synthase (glutamine-hydrolyzing) [Nitrosotalea sp.]